MKILKAKKYFFLIFSLILLSACSNKEKKEEVKNTNTEISTAIRKKEYNLDPRFSNSIDSDAVVSQIFEGLTEYSSHGKISLNQAESIEKNEDFTTWKIILKDNLKWSDGEKITAEQYVNSWISILDKENKNPNYYKLFFIKNAKTLYEGKAKLSDFGIKALDEKTIEVKMEHPVKNFDEILSSAFMFPVKDIKFYKNNFVSNSAFNLKEINDEEIVLEKNKNYWDEVNIRTNNVRLKLVENDILAYQLFELRQIDFFGLPFYEIPYERRVDASKKPEYLNFKTNICEFLDLNLENEILKHEDLRHLLDSLIDSKFLASYVLYNNSTEMVQREKIDSEKTKEIKQIFEDKISKIGIKELNLSLNYNGTKLSERLLASLSKEWLDKYKINVKLQNELSDVTHSYFNIGTMDNLDIKYYINHKYQKDDFSRLYTDINDIKKDNFIFSLFNRSFSLLVNNKIQGLNVNPNGQLLIKNIVKK